MRFIFLFSLLTVTYSAYAQDFPTPKVRYSVGFFDVSYEIGDKDATALEVQNLFEQNSSEAYYHFRKGQKQTKTGNWSAIIGAGGILLGVFSKNTETQIIGYGIGAIGMGYSVVSSLSGSSNIQKGINMYNEKFGYK